jgi:hypothetical protein
MIEIPKGKFENAFRCNYASHRVLKFNLNAQTTEISQEVVRFEQETRNELNIQKGLVTIFQTVTAFQIIAAGDELLIAEISTESIFEFEDLGSRLTGKESLGLEPFDFTVLAALSYSTNRGIILTKSAGTTLANLPLPIVDPYQLANLERPPAPPVAPSTISSTP